MLNSSRELMTRDLTAISALRPSPKSARSGTITGFISDIIIDKMNIFGNTLKPFYKLAGSGFWGGLAIAFSVVISYLIQIYLLPILL